MYTNSVLSYLTKRQLGYSGFKNELSRKFIDKIGYVYEPINTNYRTIGNTFACKFSRNKNNLHMVGCSTEYGEMIVLNSNCHYNDQYMQYRRNVVHDNAIFNFAWAEPQMNLITACGDQSTKYFNVLPSGTLDGEREFIYGSSVKCVMFCPGSSNVFCGGCQDSSIKLWDARVNNGQTVLEFEHTIPNTHGIYGSMSKKKKKPRKMFGVSSVIFKTDQTIMSCSSMDYTIKLWDLRKSYRQVNGNIEPLPLKKFFNGNKISPRFNAYTDIIINPQSTLMYASCIDNRIYCYSLESTETKPICMYSGHLHETVYSKISISHDGRYLFSGCMNNMGLIWSTDFPHEEKPMFKINSRSPKKELSASDWSADPESTKLVTSCDSMPELWSVLTLQQRRFADSSVDRTSSYKPFSTKISTVPIKFDTELREKFKKETEETMNNWDIQNQNLVPTAENLNVTPKKPWNVLFNTKTTSPSSISSQNEITSTHSTLEDSNKIPEAVTPTSSKNPEAVTPTSSKNLEAVTPTSSKNPEAVIPTSSKNPEAVIPTSSKNPEAVTPTSSRKRKISVVSPRSTIDQYLVSNSKREKLDTVNEI